MWSSDGVSPSWTERVISSAADSAQSVDVADLDDDGDLDAFVANGGPNTVWLNDGSGSFTNSGQLLGNSPSHSAALGRLDGDEDLDLLTETRFGKRVVWYWSRGC